MLGEMGEGKGKPPAKVGWQVRLCRPLLPLGSYHAIIDKVRKDQPDRGVKEGRSYHHSLSACLGIYLSNTFLFSHSDYLNFTQWSHPPLPTIHRKTYSEMDVAFRRVGTPVTEAPEVHASQARSLIKVRSMDGKACQSIPPQPRIRYNTLPYEGQSTRTPIPSLSYSVPITLVAQWAESVSKLPFSPAPRPLSSQPASPKTSTRSFTDDSTSNESQLIPSHLKTELVLTIGHLIALGTSSASPQNTPIRRSQTPSGSYFHVPPPTSESSMIISGPVHLSRSREGKAEKLSRHKRLPLIHHPRGSSLSVFLSYTRGPTTITTPLIP
ncbi:uncharacterized protein BDZ83DRAFT_653630 [Colletotrichum acutatum]|uniref:Uncharacterized protein n=1 Tax=Glomerella acutata TaxID=27357 RepID=A0AAD8XCM4_GLOAC|nr:uncharacterized protein BDZ83DRAFT_653630 [Colletotrichum acutatum]KAK1722804.1 hypothetical protein BDZ83DRAFT_653630 [Colletotrichum acutatum]